MAEIEREVFRQALVYCRGNVSEMARVLRLGRSTLYRKKVSHLQGMGMVAPREAFKRLRERGAYADL